MTTMGEPRAPLQFRTDLPAVPAPPGFEDACAEQGIAFEPGDLDRLGRFLAMLLDANQQVNLTAIKDPADAWSRHILDALTLLPVLAEIPEGARVADIGSGGGVPGVPLAIAMPHLHFTLVEATEKKAQFLRAASEALVLANVTVLNERAEALGQMRGGTGGHREGYDAVTARALGPLAVAAELTVPLATVGGIVLLVKGQKAEEELREASGAIGLLGARHAGTIDTPTGKIVVLEKASRTPRDYPRRPGIPKQKPLTSP